MGDIPTENPQCGAASPTTSLTTLQPTWLLTLAGPGRSCTAIIFTNLATAKHTASSPGKAQRARWGCQKGDTAVLNCSEERGSKEQSRRYP